MSAKLLRIEPDVLNVLERSDTDGNRLELPEQLERKLYQRVAKALDAIGCKWSKRDKCHLFPAGQDAEAAIDSLVVAGVVQLPDSFDFFRTPLAVVEKLVDHAELDRDHVLGEFSAGDGAIAAYCQGLVEAPVICCEIRADNCEQLHRKGLDPRHADFLTLTPRPLCDRIILNPPFSKAQEARHILHALKFLKPGGRLVSVMSAAIHFREHALYEQLRAELRQRGGYIEQLPDGSFRESGTLVRTCIVNIREAREGAAPAKRTDAPEHFELTPSP